MAIPNDLRLMNRRQILLASLRSGPASRSTLSRVTGISQPTTGKICDSLIDDGILRSVNDASPSPAGPGRPGMLLKVDDVKPRFLAVQLGNTHTRLAPLAVAPVLRDRWNQVIPTPHSLATWTAAVAVAAQPLLLRKPAAVVLSLPGVLDDSTRRTLLSPHLSWMNGEAVATALEEALELPVHPVQEIQCLALGHQAADPTADNFLLVDFGAGIGSAAVINGKLARGPLPFAGELGHTPVVGNTLVCGCGGIGCLETLFARNRLTELLPSSILESVTATTRVASLNGNAGQGHYGDEGELNQVEAVDRIRFALTAAGVTIASALNVLGLDRVVVTGFAADLPPELFAVLRESIERAAMASRFGKVRTEADPRHRLAGLASVALDRVIAPL